jgi:hypothetical protein
MVGDMVHALAVVVVVVAAAVGSCTSFELELGQVY